MWPRRWLSFWFPFGWIIVFELGYLDNDILAFRHKGVKNGGFRMAGVKTFKMSASVIRSPRRSWALAQCQRTASWVRDGWALRAQTDAALSWYLRSLSTRWPAKKKKKERKTNNYWKADVMWFSIKVRPSLDNVVADSGAQFQRHNKWTFAFCYVMAPGFLPTKMPINHDRGIFKS